MHGFTRLVIRGIRNLGQFRGRDTRAQFLPYLGVCCGVVAFVALACMAAFMPLPGLSADAFDAEIVLRRMATMGLVLGLVLVVLVAAAVVRRLRDSGRNAAWALLPLPFLVLALVNMSQADFGADNTPNFGFVVALVGFNALYLVAVGTLLWLLVQPSRIASPAHEGAQ